MSDHRCELCGVDDDRVYWDGYHAGVERAAQRIEAAVERVRETERKYDGLNTLYPERAFVSGPGRAAKAPFIERSARYAQERMRLEDLVRSVRKLMEDSE